MSDVKVNFETPSINFDGKHVDLPRKHWHLSLDAECELITAQITDNSCTVSYFDKERGQIFHEFVKR